MIFLKFRCVFRDRADYSGKMTVLSIRGFEIHPGYLDAGEQAAIVADLYARAVVNLARYYSDAWKRVARESDVGAAADAD